MSNRVPSQNPSQGVGDADQLLAIARLRDVFASGELSLAEFSGALEQVLAASTDVDLEVAMLGLPSLVRLTPTSRRLSQPLVIEAKLSHLVLGAGWQLGTQTAVSATRGSVRLDLTAATWDAREVDLGLEVRTGSIEVIVPRGVAVQVAAAKGQLSLDALDPPVPGAPVLRVSATATTGAIRIAHPPQTASRRTPWSRRRRAPASGPP